MLGGMRAVTWTQVAQYIVLITAYLLPIFWISNRGGYGFFPHLMLGEEVARLGELEAQFGLVKNAAADIKAAGVPGGLKSISLTSLWSTCRWNGCLEIYFISSLYDGRNGFFTTYLNEIFHNA